MVLPLIGVAAATQITTILSVITTLASGAADLYEMFKDELTPEDREEIERNMFNTDRSWDTYIADAQIRLAEKEQPEEVSDAAEPPTSPDDDEIPF